MSLNHCEPVYFSSKHRSHKLARLKVDDEVGHVKSGDLTRIRGQNGPGDDYLAAAAAWHSKVYGATKREKSPSTQLNLSLVEKKLDLRLQTSLCPHTVHPSGQATHFRNSIIFTALFLAFMKIRKYKLSQKMCDNV